MQHAGVDEYRENARPEMKNEKFLLSTLDYLYLRLSSPWS